jgi:hypothetical protein
MTQRRFKTHIVVMYKELTGQTKSSLMLSNPKLRNERLYMDSYNHHSYGQCDVDAPNFRLKGAGRFRIF